MTRLRYAVEPQSSGPLVLGIASDGDHVVVVGGQRTDYYLVSEDGGRSFEPRESPGKGLRSAWVDGDDVWVCGEYGYAAHSPDRGHTWHVLETGASACLFGVAKVDEDLYLAGDNGFLIRVSPEGDVEYIEVTRSGFSRFSPHRDGLLLPGDAPGQLWVVSPNPPRKLTINAGYNLMKARVLDSGTLMVVGSVGQVFRSEDNGETFRQVPGEFSGILCGVESVGDAVYIVGQDRQIWRSSDDGRSFSAVEHDLGSGYFWCCERVGDVLMVGAHDGAVIQIGEFTSPTTALAAQVEVNPPQLLTTRRRSTSGRPRSMPQPHQNYIRGHVEADTEALVKDQPRAVLPDLDSDEVAAARACLGRTPREEFEALLELYADGKMPSFDGLQLRIGRRTRHDRATLVEMLTGAYGQEEARRLAATIRESVELFAVPDGPVLIATHDGVWEWVEEDPGLRRVCANIGVLYHLLIRAVATELGRFDKADFVAELDMLYDDWLEFEFFEERAY